MSVALPGIHIPIPNPLNLLIPGISNPVTNPINTLTNVFNPFDWVNSALHGLANDEIGLFEKAVINPPPQLPHSWTDYLYGNALGLAGTLAVAVATFLIVYSMVKRRVIASAFEAILVAIAIGAFAPLYFGAMDWLIGWGTSLARAAMFYHGGSSSLFDIPSFSNTLGSIIGLGMIWGVGSITVAIMDLYLFIIVLVKFAGLLAFALWPLGDRAKAFCNWLISLGLVAMVFGRPVAVLCLEIGKAIFDSGALGTGWFAGTFVIVTSFLMALVAQFILIKVTHKQVTKIAGGTHSTVQGAVDATLKQGSQGTMTAAYNAHGATMQPLPSGSDGSKRSSGGHALRDSATALVAVRIAEGAAASTIPGSTIVAGALHQHARRKSPGALTASEQNKKAKDGREVSHD